MPTLPHPKDPIFMQPALAIIALLAPLPAAAFGDLDCITVESCTGDTCTPESDDTSGTDMPSFSITVDLAAQQASITADGQTSVLAMMKRPRTTVLEGDPPIIETTADFGDLDDPLTAHMRLQGQDSTTGSSIHAFYTIKTPTPMTQVAYCTVRQAS